MQELAMLMHLLWPFSFIAFAVAFISMVVANRYIAGQEYDTARVWTLISAISATVVLMFEVVMFIATLSPFAGFLIIVWGYFSYVTWKQYSRLG